MIWSVRHPSSYWFGHGSMNMPHVAIWKVGIYIIHCCICHLFLRCYWHLWLTVPSKWRDPRWQVGATEVKNRNYCHLWWWSSPCCNNLMKNPVLCLFSTALNHRHHINLGRSGRSGTGIAQHVLRFHSMVSLVARRRDILLGFLAIQFHPNKWTLRTRLPSFITRIWEVGVFEI